MTYWSLVRISADMSFRVLHSGEDQERECRALFEKMMTKGTSARRFVKYEIRKNGRKVVIGYPGIQKGDIFGRGYALDIDGPDEFSASPFDESLPD